MQQARGLSCKALGIAVAISLACIGQDAVAATWGLVVGIDAYRSVTPLKGALNDARDIAAALEEAGAERVWLLLDEAASRAAILGAWREMTAAAQPGDTVVFSYAGHGAQEAERLAGSEADGLDEVFLLGGFSPSGPGTAERIPDDEINALFAAVPELTVVFIADSCHSGTMTRAFDPRVAVVSTRLGAYGAIQEDALPPPDPAAATMSEADLPHVVFFGAVEDGELALEIAIEGEARGALSWAFGRALRGQADQDGDRRLDTRELESYLVETVRAVTEGRQYPQLVPRGRDVIEAVAIAGGTLAPNEAPLTVAVLGAPPSAGTLHNVVLVPDATLADLVWDRTRGQVLSAAGDLLATEGVATPEAFQAIADKWLLLRDLRFLAESVPLAARLLPDDGVHRDGEKLEFRLEAQPAARLTLFNLASDGTVQFLAPHRATSNPRYDGKLTPGRDYRLPLQVAPPFGADHLVALVSDRRLPELEEALLRLDGSKGAAALRPLLQAAATELRGAAAVGLYTASRTE